MAWDYLQPSENQRARNKNFLIPGYVAKPPNVWYGKNHQAEVGYDTADGNSNVEFKDVDAILVCSIPETFDGPAGADRRYILMESDQRISHVVAAMSSYCSNCPRDDDEDKSM